MDFRISTTLGGCRAWGGGVHSKNLDSKDILNSNSKKSNFILESATSVIESFSNKSKLSIEKIINNTTDSKLDLKKRLPRLLTRSLAHDDMDID